MRKMCMSVCSEIQCARTVGGKICNFDLENERISITILNRWPIFFCDWTRRAGCHVYLAAVHVLPSTPLQKPMMKVTRWLHKRRRPAISPTTANYTAGYFFHRNKCLSNFSWWKSMLRHACNIINFDNLDIDISPHRHRMFWNEFVSFTLKKSSRDNNYWPRT